MKQMPLTTELVLATRRDATAIALLSRNLVEYGLPWRWTPSRVERCIRHREYIVLVARSSPEIAGFAIMRYLDREAHLCLLAVAPRLRRRGVGRRLLRWLEESAVVAGVFRTRLEVRSSDPSAVEFYRSMGYRDERVLRAYYSNREAALRMTRDLRAGTLEPPSTIPPI